MNISEKNFNRVSSLRRRLGLSQTAFANKLGVSRNYVSMLEGGREPSESLSKLMDTMEKQADETRQTFPIPDSRPVENMLQEDATPYNESPVDQRLRLMMSRVREDAEAMICAPPEKRERLAEMAKSHITHFLAWLGSSESDSDLDDD